MFILDNLYCDRQILVDNQYYHYYYGCIKLCLSIYFLNDYYNVMLVKIKKRKKIILKLYFILK